MSPSRFLIPGLNVVLTFVIGLCLAYWLWTLWALGQNKPGATAPITLSANPAAMGAKATGTAFFGQPENPAKNEIGQSRQNLRLSGTFGGSKTRPNVAIIAADGGKPTSHAEGSEVSPGLVVHQVGSDHVLLKRNGVLERLDIDRKPAGNTLIQAAQTRR